MFKVALKKEGPVGANVALAAASSDSSVPPRKKAKVVPAPCNGGGRGAKAAAPKAAKHGAPSGLVVKAEPHVPAVSVCSSYISVEDRRA